MNWVSKRHGVGKWAGELPIEWGDGEGLGGRGGKGLCGERERGFMGDFVFPSRRWNKYNTTAASAPGASWLKSWNLKSPVPREISFVKDFFSFVLFSLFSFFLPFFLSFLSIIPHMTTHLRFSSLRFQTSMSEKGKERPRQSNCNASVCTARM